MNREQAKGALGLLAGLALLAGCFFLEKKDAAREPITLSLIHILICSATSGLFME